MHSLTCGIFSIAPSVRASLLTQVGLHSQLRLNDRQEALDCRRMANMFPIVRTKVPDQVMRIERVPKSQSQFLRAVP